MADEQIVGFTPDGARRVARTTRVVEQAYRLPPLDRYRTPVMDATPVKPAKVTVTITARSGATLGAGFVDLYHYEGEFPDVSAVLDVPTTNVGVVNKYGASISAGSWVDVVFSGGQWSLLSADCP